MASKKLSFHARRSSPNYIFVNPETDFNNNIPSSHSHHHHHHNLFEFDESDVWNINHNNTEFEAKKMIPNKGSSGGGRNIMISRPPAVSACSASSLPVNIPDWSKIYREDHHHHHQDHDQDQETDDDDEGDQDYRVPPHEYLARKRGASFSVHEGIGRTLKGRDLRQMRNAIWKTVGFED